MAETLTLDFADPAAAARWEAFVQALSRRYPSAPSLAERFILFCTPAEPAPSAPPPQRRSPDYDGSPMARPIRLTTDQREIFEQAAKLLSQQLGDAVSEGRLVELLAADYLSGRHAH